MLEGCTVYDGKDVVRVLADVQVVKAQAYGYMAIYEIDSNDVPGTLRNLQQATWLNMGDSIDLSSLDISIFESIE